jgi:hypothetical protein
MLAIMLDLKTKLRVSRKVNGSLPTPGELVVDVQSRGRFAR